MALRIHLSQGEISIFAIQVAPVVTGIDAVVHHDILSNEAYVPGRLRRGDKGGTRSGPVTEGFTAGIDARNIKLVTPAVGATSESSAASRELASFVVKDDRGGVNIVEWMVDGGSVFKDADLVATIRH